MVSLINKIEIQQAYRLLVEPGQVVELRALKATVANNGQYPGTYGGYFNNEGALLNHLALLKKAKGVYVSLQVCKPDLIHRSYNNLQRQETTTADKDITRYRWLLIDSDPDRPVSDISASHFEHSSALQHSRMIAEALTERGWPAPVFADSGNGGHLLYRIDLPVADKDLVKRTLEGLAKAYDTVDVHVDQTVYNPARICKLYGTLVCKGDNTVERPHRMSRLLEVPEQIQIVPRELLEEVAGPDQSIPLALPDGVKESFSAEDFLLKHHIDTYPPQPYVGGTRWKLKTCAWNGHTDKSACVYQFADGRLGASCSHNSCKGKGWREFRVVFEPDAYIRKVTPPSGDHHPQTKGFNLTDLGNAERFASRYRDTVRWCETWNTWMIFNGKCWEPDRINYVGQLAKRVVRSIYQEAANEPDEPRRKLLAKHASSSESNRAIRAMLDRAKSELPVLPEAFNVHLYLLNCENGTLDLRTGKLRPHRPSDMLTRCLKINYNPQATCQRWATFIDGIFAGDETLISFMQQALGMSLCGDTSEQCLFICHGTGSNGKTTMLETIRIIMGNYALAANIETFQMKKHEGIGNDVAELYGARFVTASENALGSRLNEAFIKKATGKEPLRARRLHENEFEFMPEFTIWFAVNHKPVVKDTSKGMWRRVHFVPFNVTIEGDKLDKHLGEKLLEESEGILAWLVQGCMQWYKQGRLEAPKAVKDATQAYRSEMDIVSRFLEAECVLGDDKKAGVKQVLDRFESWCKQNGESFDAKHLKSALNERGYQSKRSTGGLWVWSGIGLLSDGSDGSDGKSKVSYARENTLQKTPNSPSLTVTTSLSEHKNEPQSDGTVTCEPDEARNLSSPDQGFATLRHRIEDHIAYKKRYVQRVPQELLWYVSGQDKEALGFDAYLARVDESDPPVAIEAMRRTLGEYEE